MSDDTVREGEFVPSLERCLSVIRAFNAEHPELTLSGVAKITGLTRAAARRFLHTLVDLGYMRPRHCRGLATWPAAPA
jgi:IclR family transcriptional regulator, pca regulon regulatory protein